MTDTARGVGAFVLVLCLFGWPGLTFAQSSKPSFEGLKALQHPEASVRYKAAAVLAALGPQAKFAVAELRKALGDADPFVRVKVAEALWKVEQPLPKVVLPTLLKALDDKNASVRASAARVLGMLGPRAKAAAPALIKMLTRDEVDVKIEVALALAEFGPAAKEAVQPLLDLTDDKDLILLEPYVVAALGSVGASAVPPLTQALKSGDVRKRRVAAAALDYMGKEARGALEALQQGVHAKEPYIRAACCSALGKIGPDAKPALGDVRTACGDKEANVRIKAALAVWQISGVDKTWTILAESLSDESLFRRQAACEALGVMGPAAKDAASALSRRLEDKKEEDSVRLEAAFAHWRVTGQTEAAVKVLRSFVSDDSTEQQFVLRGRALKRIKEMGPAAKALSPFLVELVRDEDGDFRVQAAETLKVIDAEAAAKAGIR